MRAEGTFTRTNGTTGKIADVLLDGNQTDSKYLGDSSVSAQAAALPTLKGYGNVTDLRPGYFPVIGRESKLLAGDIILLATDEAMPIIRRGPRALSAVGCELRVSAPVLSMKTQEVQPVVGAQ